MENNPYFALVNNPNKGVRLSNIERFFPSALPNIDVLMKVKLLYGQRYLFEPDMLLFYVGIPLGML